MQTPGSPVMQMKKKKKIQLGGLSEGGLLALRCAREKLGSPDLRAILVKFDLRIAAVEACKRRAGTKSCAVIYMLTSILVCCRV